MAEFDPQEQQKLEQTVHDMQWQEVSLVPGASWADIEKDLPTEWTQEVAQVFTQEELAELLEAPIDGPEGDIDTSVEQALQELDIDVQAIASERDTELDLPQQEQEFDFDR